MGRVQNALRAVPEAEDVVVNLATGTAAFNVRDNDVVTKAGDALEAAGYPARLAETTLDIQAMSCASCVGRVERAIGGALGVHDVAVNLVNATARVTYFVGVATPAAIAARSTEAGYPATVRNAQPEQDRAARPAQAA